MICSLRYHRLLFVVFFFVTAFAKTSAQKVSPQAFSAWAARNDFQAGQDWRSYLRIAPANMGPNALPVMQTIQGEVDSIASFGVSANLHTMTGDQANDLVVELRYPFGDRASLRIRYVMVEWFEMSEQLALARNVLTVENSGLAYGDVSVDGLFQVIKAQPKFPDFTVGIRIKTASGTALESMRNTDAPGYAFEGSFGKSYALKKWNITLRPYASGGFFVWQRYNRQTPQNDAYTYSVGCAQQGARLNAFLELAGYSGWERSLDQPVVIRGGLSSSGKLKAQLHVSKGLRDFQYLTVGAGLSYGW